jgi:hypothetical protein
VGLAASGNFLVVMTEGTPYVATGTAPENIVLERLDVNLPCLSKRGIVDLGIGVAYPSHDGLVLVSGYTPQVVTRDLFDRRTWRQMQPSTMWAGHYDGRYVFSYIPSGGSRETGIIDLTGDMPGFVKNTNAASAFSYDLVTGKLHYSDGTTTIREFADTDSNWSSIDWSSGILHFPAAAKFGCVRVDGTQLPGTFFAMRVYADGVLRDTITNLNSIERLSAGDWATKWYVRVTGTVLIERITLAGGPSELQGG